MINPSNVVEYISWFEVMELISLKDEALSQEISRLSDIHFNNLIKGNIKDEQTLKNIKYEAQKIITFEKNSNIERLKWLKKNNGSIGKYSKLIELGKLYSSVIDAVDKKLLIFMNTKN